VTVKGKASSARVIDAEIIAGRLWHKNTSADAVVALATQLKSPVLRPSASRPRKQADQPVARPGDLKVTIVTQ
jgi:hypothetical protein